MTNKFKRFLSLLLAMVMVIGMFPVSAFAVEGEEATDWSENVIMNFDFDSEDVVYGGDDSITGIKGTVKTENGDETVTAEVKQVVFENGVAVYEASEDDTSTGITYAPAEGADPMANLTEGATIALWVKNSQVGTFVHPIFSYGALTAAGTGMGASVQMGIRTDNKEMVLYRNNAGSTGGHKFGFATEIAADEWHLAVLVEGADGANKYYIDGVEVGTHNGSDKTLKGFADDEYEDNYYIGFLPFDNDDTHFAGEIDSVTVYDVAMTADDVAALYAAREDEEPEEPAQGTEENPILLLDLENEVVNAGTTYYQGYFNGMNMTVTGETGFEVIYNGEEIADTDGVVSMAVASANPRMPVVFAIVGDGAYNVDFAYPAGSMENPAALADGENTAEVAANSMGYYLTWTAEENGELTIAVDTAKTTNWTYAINNMTTYAYGDNHASSDPTVVSSETVKVEAGDEIQVVLGTADWTAGTVVINASFEKEVVTIPATGIVAKDTDVEIVVGETKALEYTLEPEGANAAMISWYTEDTDVIELDQSGNVYGLAAGTATVQANLNGGNGVEYTVTVVEKATEPPVVEPPVVEDGVVLNIDFTDVTTAEDGTVTVNSEVGGLALTVGNNVTVADGVATFAEGNNGIYATNVDNETDPMTNLTGPVSTTNIWIKPEQDTFANTIFAYGHVQDNQDLGASMELLAVSNTTYDSILYYRNEAGATGGQKIQGQDTSKYVAGQWQLLSLVENNGTSTVYINGVQIGQKADLTRSMSGWAKDALMDNYYIGAKHATGTQTAFVGQIDSLTVLDKAMTADELAAMYEEHVYGEGVVLDSAWEVENGNENLAINDNGSVTITTEPGVFTGSSNAMYYELPQSNDYVFTVKVNGEFVESYQGAFLGIASGKEWANAITVGRRYHGYFEGTYGTADLFGMMNNNSGEFYMSTGDIGDTFYLRLKKNAGTITGWVAKEYSADEADWTQVIDGVDATKVNFVNEGLSAADPLYLVLGANCGGGEVANTVTFSDLKIDGNAVAFTTDPRALKEISLTGDTEMLVGNYEVLDLKATDYAGLQTEVDSITFTSSDETVATVTNAGVVNGLKNGFATITATATKGNVTKTASITIQVGEIEVDGTWTVESPDKNIKITVELITGGTLQYRVTHGDVTTIYNSPMGLVTNLGDFSKNLELKEASEITEIDEKYKMLSGKDDEYIDHCFEQTLTFVRKDNADVEFDVVIRAYDDGAAYRYGIRGEDGAELRISDETSGLQMPAQADVYWMNYSSAGWNYESNYNTTTTEGLAVGSTPSMPFMYGKDGVYTLFTESNLHGTYTGSMLTMGQGGLLDVAFSKTQGTTPVTTTAPFESPWRVAITGDLEAIVENTLVENLADPADYETYKFDEWVYPGLSSWSWVSNWGQGFADQSKGETHLEWIEFGGQIGWDFYILDEGWTVGGRNNVQPNASGMRDWWPEVKAAAEEAGVKLWAWVYVGDIRDNAKREAIFEYWASEGIVGIKPDFFDGENQATAQLYDEIYEDAAAAGLMVLVHGANKPTGEVRTWPNVYGREAVKGQESGGITAEQYTLIPYIRAAVGPTEITEELRSKDYNKTTMGFQIALTALIEDGIHSMGSRGNVYLENPEGLAYYTNYPGGWIDTEFVSGEIGEYVNIARLANNDSNEWYVSGISVDPRTQEVPLSFLDNDKTYIAMLYKENGRQDLVEETIAGLTYEDTLEVSNLYGGGYAARLIPAEDIETFTKITAPAEVTVATRATVTPEIVCEPADAPYTNLIWTSADEAIATVSDGVITGVAEGTTTVTVAAAFDREVKAEIKVTVTSSMYEYKKIEAESGVLNGGEIRTENADTHSGGAYVGGWDNGGSATYTFTSGADGDVVMEIYGCSAQERGLVVTINGQTLNVSTANTGSWNSTNNALLATVTIPVVEGENTMVVGGPAAANAPNVDYFVVAVPKPDPELVVLEAEEALLENGARPSSTNPDVIGWIGDTTEGTVTFKFDRASNGIAVMNIYYAAGDMNPNRTLAYTVNGGQMQVVTAGSTGGWGTPSTEPITVEIMLKQGENTIVFSGEGNGAQALNMDCIEIVKVAPRATLKGESAAVAAGGTVEIPVTLANAKALQNAADADGAVGGIQFTINGGETVSVKDFKPGEVFADYEWGTKNNIVIGFNLSMEENTSVKLSEDTVIGTLVLQTTADFDGATVAFEEVTISDGVGFTYTVNIESFELTADGTVVPPEPPVNPFDDVEEDDYCYNAVMWAVENEITTGTEPGKFEPDASATRGQVVTFLWRAAGKPEPTITVNPFTDVESDDYCYTAILWAVEEGITKGTTATTFEPDATCTRGEVATFLYRYDGENPVNAENPFKDVEAKRFYYNAVLWAVENEITTGTEPGLFEPTANCTRGQIVTFLYRYLVEA